MARSVVHCRGCGHALAVEVGPGIWRATFKGMVVIVRTGGAIIGCPRTRRDGTRCETMQVVGESPLTVDARAPVPAQ